MTLFNTGWNDKREIITTFNVHVILAAMIKGVGKFIASSDITLAAMMEGI